MYADRVPWLSKASCFYYFYLKSNPKFALICCISAFLPSSQSFLVMLTAAYALVMKVVLKI